MFRQFIGSDWSLSLLRGVRGPMRALEGLHIVAFVCIMLKEAALLAQIHNSL